MIFCENPNGKFPCGKCRACRLVKANKKMIVSVFAAHEYKKNGQFLTLTFNDKFKPDGLDHTIFSNFMKRLRKRDGTPDVKFFMAGEYGEAGDMHREHFHVLFYNHRYDMDDVRAAWSDPVSGESFGFTYDGTCTPQSIKYVSGYVDKKGYDPESGKKPPYGRSSCNIPDGMTAAEIEQMARTGKVRYNGRTFSAPDLYRRRYNDIWKEYQPQREYDRHMREVEDIKNNGYVTPERLAAHIKHIKAQMDERDLKAAVKKAAKMKKRLQKTLKRRIM